MHVWVKMFPSLLMIRVHIVLSLLASDDCWYHLQTVWTQWAGVVKWINLVSCTQGSRVRAPSNDTKPLGISETFKTRTTAGWAFGCSRTKYRLLPRNSHKKIRSDATSGFKLCDILIELSWNNILKSFSRQKSHTYLPSKQRVTESETTSTPPPLPLAPAQFYIKLAIQITEIFSFLGRGPMAFLIGKISTATP